MIVLSLATSSYNILILDMSWVCGNGEELPFEDNSFDVYTIAFGIRNFTNVDKVYIKFVSLSMVVFSCSIVCTGSFLFFEGFG